MHDYKILTHPLLEFYFPNNYITYNETEVNVLGIKVMINRHDISHIYEVAEIIVRSYLAHFEKHNKGKTRSNVDKETRVIHHNDMRGRARGGRDTSRRDIGKDGGPGDRRPSSLFHDTKKRKSGKGPELRNEAFNYKEQKTSIDRNLPIRADKKPDVFIVDDKSYLNSGQIDQSISKDKIYSIKINKDLDVSNTDNYSKVMQMCKLNDFEFPEFMIEKQNDVFFCRTEFLNNMFTSKYHYEKNSAKEEACAMMINFIQNIDTLIVEKDADRMKKNYFVLKN